MSDLTHRITHLETTVLEDDEAGDSAVWNDPTAYRLIVCRPPGEPDAAALARWGLTRADIPEGVSLYLGPCHPEHTHFPPMLVCSRPTGTASTRHAAAYEATVNEALAWSPEERARRQQERWEQVRERLRQWKAQEPDPTKEPAG